MAPSPMLQARLKELERGRAAATTPKSADLEDTILGPLGRRLDAEEKGEALRSERNAIQDIRNKERLLEINKKKNTLLIERHAKAVEERKLAKGRQTER